jgi:hypothetical protein
MCICIGITQTLAWYLSGGDQNVEKEVTETKKKTYQFAVIQNQASCISKHSEDFGGRND